MSFFLFLCLVVNLCSLFVAILTTLTTTEPLLYLYKGKWHEIMSIQTQNATSVNDIRTFCTGIWSPSSKPSTEVIGDLNSKKTQDTKAGEDASPVVWTPKSAGTSPSTERKEFRPVNFESPTLSRKNKSATSTPAPFKPADVSYRWRLSWGCFILVLSAFFVFSVTLVLLTSQYCG